MAPPLAITFLGTRDGARSPRTNTSAQLVERGDVGLLVDAGLGATRQLLRAGVRPADLEGLLLTHWHPDHVGGLVPLLRRRWTARAPRLPVFGPSPPRVLAPLVRHGIDLTPARPGQAVSSRASPARRSRRCTARRRAAGCWRTPTGAASRSPATRGPSRSVVDAVRGVDVLVYEATFAAHHAERAVKSGHSTATEAGALAAGRAWARSS